MTLPTSEKTPSSLPQEANWQNFRRLITYAKPYKLGFITAIIGMLGYAAIDVYFLSKLQPLIDEGLQGTNPNFMKWAPMFVVVAFVFRGGCHFVSNTVWRG